MKKDTQCIHEGYAPSNGQSRVLPITMSTAFRYDTAEQVGDLFDLKDNGFFYTRLGNPTIDAVEKKLAALEGGDHYFPIRAKIRKIIENFQYFPIYCCATAFVGP